MSWCFREKTISASDYRVNEAIRVREVRLIGPTGENVGVVSIQEALRIARDAKPDIILLDIMLPKMDGNEVCRLVKSDPATAQSKVLMLSGMAQRTDAQASRNMGADAYMTKPFSAAAIVGKVAELLG